MQNFKTYTDISESIKYHISNEIPLIENVYRVGSDSYFLLFADRGERK